MTDMRFERQLDETVNPNPNPGFGLGWRLGWGEGQQPRSLSGYLWEGGNLNYERCSLQRT